QAQRCAFHRRACARQRGVLSRADRNRAAMAPRCAMRNVRIGAGLGFYGDSWLPIRATLERGDVQYIVSDHLSELTLAILRKDLAKDPSTGYTRDLVPMLTALWPLAAKRGVRFVLTAGPLN